MNVGLDFLRNGAYVEPLVHFLPEFCFGLTDKLWIFKQSLSCIGQYLRSVEHSLFCGPAFPLRNHLPTVSGGSRHDRSGYKLCCGIILLASPTSLLPASRMSICFHGRIKSDIGRLRYCLISLAKANSSAVYDGRGTRFMLSYKTPSRTEFESVSEHPLSNRISTVVSVIIAAPSAILHTLS